MAIVGIQIDRNNPDYKCKDFTFWMPQYKNYMATKDGKVMFKNLYEIANAKIFKSIWGTDWKMAMSYCIAHYATLIGNQMQSHSGNTLDSISGHGRLTGVMSSASIGNFSKSLDIGKTVLDSKEALFWNQTSYGRELMALFKTKAVPSIFVVTNDFPRRR